MIMHNQLAEVAARHYDRLEAALERRHRVLKQQVKQLPGSYWSHAAVAREVELCAVRASGVEFRHTLAMIAAEPEDLAAA